jgi:hypothetical protein
MPHRNLTAPETRALLCGIANICDVGSNLLLRRKLRGMLKSSPFISHDDVNSLRSSRGLPPLPLQDGKKLVAELDKVYHENILLPLRNELRKIWTERNPTEKRHAILRLVLDEYSWSFPAGGEPIRTQSPLSQMLEYLLRPNVRTAVCANPDCLTPYFFPRRRQKVCSDECARPFQREAKLRYWNKTGRHKRAELQLNRKRRRSSLRRRSS